MKKGEIKMWIEFNDVLFKLEDIIYISKENITTDYGTPLYQLSLITQNKTFTKRYVHSRDGYMEREKQYNQFKDILLKN